MGVPEGSRGASGGSLGHCRSTQGCFRAHRDFSFRSVSEGLRGYHGVSGAFMEVSGVPGDLRDVSSGSQAP